MKKVLFLPFHRDNRSIDATGGWIMMETSPRVRAYRPSHVGYFVTKLLGRKTKKKSALKKNPISFIVVIKMIKLS